MKRWIKVPGPGEFRGEGKWVDFDTVQPWFGESRRYVDPLSDTGRDSFWGWVCSMGWLPIATGEDPPGVEGPSK